MKLSYDPTKSERNVRERCLSFERARDFDFEAAKFWEDEFVETEEGIRVISFSKANDREGKKLGFAQKRG